MSTRSSSLLPAMPWITLGLVARVFLGTSPLDSTIHRASITIRHSAPEAPADPEPSPQPRHRAVWGLVQGTDGRPLSSAQVSIPELGVGTLSGSNGLFALEGVPVDGFTLRVDLIGYGSAEVQVPAGLDNARVPFGLESLALVLTEFVVIGRPLGAEPQSGR